MYVVGDVGGTNTRVAASEDLSSFKTPEIFPTAQDPDEGIRHFVEAALKATGGAAPEHAVVGIPGILKESRDELYRSPHLPQWENIELRKKI
jgi:predicted NBD/HSP70 family sugar kinase